MKKKIHKVFLFNFVFLLGCNFNDVFANNSNIEKNEDNVIYTDSKNVKTDKKYILTKEEYKGKSATELSELVKEGKITSEQLVKTAFEIIKEENKEINAVIATREEEALKDAKYLDSLPKNEKTAPFFGVPTLLKGLGHTIKDLPATNGFLHEKNKIAKTDSSVAKNFKNLGFVLLGVTNYPEYGMRNITDSKLYGVAKNPINKEYNAGGSSGGAAAAVASGMVPLASASDIGGSIRIPASWTGTIGLKPTSSSYLGTFPIVKFTKDLEKFFFVTNEKNKSLVNISDIKQLKIGYSINNFGGIELSEDAKKATLTTVKFLKEQGFTVEEVEYPLNLFAMLELYTRLNAPSFKDLEKKLSKENLTKYDVDPLTWAFYIYNKDVIKNENIVVEDKKKLEQQVLLLEKFYEKYPILLTPTTTQIAPKNTDAYVTEEMKEKLYNFENIPKEERFVILLKQWEPMFKKTPFTLAYNLTKVPAISLPIYTDKNNMPLGVMFSAPKNYDKVLIELAKIFEYNNMFKIPPFPKKELIIEKINEEEQNREKVVTINNNNFGATNEVEQKNNMKLKKEKKLTKTGKMNNNYIFLGTSILCLVTLLRKKWNVNKKL